MNKQLLESIRYLVMGILTTLVNYVIYHALDLLLQKQSISPFFSYKISYGVAFFLAVVFAYYGISFFLFPESVFRHSQFFPAGIFCGYFTFFPWAGMAG